jgi:hypothetical protein
MWRLINVRNGVCARLCARTCVCVRVWCMFSSLRMRYEVEVVIWLAMGNLVLLV